MSDFLWPLFWFCAWVSLAGLLVVLWSAADRACGRYIERHVSNALDYDDTAQGWAERADRVPDDGLARLYYTDDYDAAAEKDYR